jgi:LEA14-like dessication related protein
MSHFSIIKISIKNPDLQLLKQVVEQIARELNAEVVNTIKDYYGNALSVLIGIRSSIFHRGIGIIVNNKGEVEVVGDFYRVPISEVEKFKQLLTQYYTASALTSALANLGYSVQIQKVDDKIYIRAFTL